MQQFIIELNNLNIYEHLNQNIDSSPQAIMKYYLNLLNARKTVMYLPKRKVKYNKKRLMKSSWMTRIRIRIRIRMLYFTKQ